MAPPSTPNDHTNGIRTPGRAAGSNATNRFEPYQRERLDDSWGKGDDLPVLRTEVRG